MRNEIRIPIIDMVTSLSGVLDLMNRTLVDHHRRVAYIAVQIARQAGLDTQKQNDLIVAGTLHDIGAISLQERLDLINYEDSSTVHAEQGFQLFQTFEPFHSIAKTVRFHHYEWNHGKGSSYKGDSVPETAHILHLADRIEILIDRKRDILMQKEEVRERAQKDAGRIFHPEMVEHFLEVSSNDAFWLDLESADLGRILERSTLPVYISLDLDKLEEFGRFFARVIDLRSRFTATHSSGVAAVARELSLAAGFSPEEGRLMLVAGFLHDLGKVSIPVEILEKNGKLSKKEKMIIRRHTYYTFRILDRIPGLELVNEWASLHHERLDGTGYPFGYHADEIPVGSRILAIADIFTALAEERPYRKGGDRSEVMGILRKEVESGGLDGRLVDLLEQNFDSIEKTRASAQLEALQDYEKLFVDYRNSESPVPSGSDATPGAILSKPAWGKEATG